MLNTEIYANVETRMSYWRLFSDTYQTLVVMNISRIDLLNCSFLTFRCIFFIRFHHLNVCHLVMRF